MKKLQSYLLTFFCICNPVLKIKIVALAVLLTGVNFSAKSQDQGPSFGLRGGLNIQNIKGKDQAGDNLNLNLVPRFHVGVVVEFPITNNFYFQPGLLFTTKGTKSENEFLGINMDAEYNLSYLDLPLNFIYKADGHLFLGLGPYIAYGVGGKAKFDIAGISTEQDIIFENEVESLNLVQWRYFKPFDYGINLLLGFQFENGFLLQLNTQLGLAKINADNTAYPNSDSEFRNIGFGLSLGYNF